jgi:polyisoprenoid-binding protein YceI
MTSVIEPRAAGATTWAVDAAHTNVEFAVKHLMISTVKGRFGDVTGSLKGDIDNPSTFGLDVRIDVASIDTRQAQRDAHLRSPDFFNADQWPSITFTGKRVEGKIGDEFKLVGDLMIRDVTREITLDVTSEGSVTDPWGNPRIGFSARGKVDRRDFGLTWNQALEAGGFVVGDEVKISVDVEFTAVPETEEA